MATIHPSAFVAPSADVLGDVRLGEQASVWYQCVLRADMEPITVGARSNIQDLTIVHVDEGMPCTIGDDVTVGHRAIIHACTIENGALIGMGAVLLNNVVVGAGSVIAAGAVVPENMKIPPGSLVMGVPAKIRGEVSPALKERIRLGVDHYVRLAAEHRAGKHPRRGMVGQWDRKTVL